MFQKYHIATFITMHIPLKFILLPFLAFGVAGALAQSVSYNELRNKLKVENGKLYTLDGGRPTEAEIDSVRTLMSDFYFDQFRHFDDPDAPYFMFMSRDANLSMGIGGSIRIKTWYEWDGALPVNGLFPSYIPIPTDPARQKHLGANASGTELFFKIIGNQKVLGEYKLYIQAGFSGYDNVDFKLKKAYATLRNVTVGYATSTFSDPVALAPDFDAAGVNSKIDQTRVLVRYMPTFKEKYTFAVSAEYPSKGSVQSTDGKTEATTQYMPDFAAFMQYGWAPGNHVRLSGIIRTLGYRNLLTSRNHNVTGWGVQLSTAANLHPQLEFFGTVNYGRGMSGITNDFLAGNYDLVGDPVASPGVLYAPRSFGWSAGLQYSIRPNLFLSGAFSQTRYLPNHREASDAYKYGLYAFGLIGYDLTPRIMLAGQFTWGMRHNMDGAHKAARRVEFVALFNF